MSSGRCRRSLRGVADDTTGQALVEFALVMPIFLILVLGTVSFSRAWSVHQTLSEAARQGARQAALASPSITADSVLGTVRQSMGLANLDTLAAQITIDGVGGEPGAPARVTISYPLRLPFLQSLVPGSGQMLNLSTSVVMRHE